MATLSPLQKQRLALITRERYVAAVARALPEIGAAVQARFSTLMYEKATNKEAQSRRDAWSAFGLAQSRWTDGTAKAWHSALKPEVSSTNGKASKGELKLELMDMEAMDSKIVASRLVQKMMETLSAPLLELQQRIKSLENIEQLGERDVLNLEFLIALMLEQWSASEMPNDSWSMVAEVVVGGLSDRLKSVFTQANEFLIQQGVLTTVELNNIKRTPDSPNRERPTGAAAASAVSGLAQGAASRAASSASLAHEGSSLGRARDQALGVIDQLKRVLGGRLGMQFASASAGASAGGSAVGVPHVASPRLAAAIALRPNTDAAYDGGEALIADYAAGGVIQVAGHLRTQTEALKKTAETHDEKAIIEIVALMFQSILTESRIPPAIRVWFARLQMPVLREALSDPDFISTLDHPARLLIDRMGSCVMGFDASGISDGALEGEIKRVVQVVEQYPETGKRVYQLMYDEFQEFLTKLLAQTGVSQRVVGVAQQVEEKETLAIQYTIELRKLLHEQPVHEAIRNFLFKVWAEVLALATLRHGAQHADTIALKKAASDLLWAASAKPNRTERARVIQQLPQLLQQLRGGMALINLPASEQEAHFKSVSDALADAFMSKTQAIPQAQIEAMALRLANLEDYISDDEAHELPLDAQTIEDYVGIDASTLDVVVDGGSKPSADMVAMAKQLQIGAWFALDHNGKVAQVQFVWRSDRKHLNLFAAPDGHSYLIQAKRLAAYLQANLLVPQETETLTARATRDALAKIEANPERLIN